MVSLKPGLVGEATLIVEEKHSAHHLRSGGVHVLATPIMIALMEEAAHNLVDPLLEPGKLSVGTNPCCQSPGRHPNRDEGHGTSGAVVY
jgi:predicted thioesterase